MTELEEIAKRWEVHENHLRNPSLSAHVCPLCGNKGRWRSGVYFEHQKICMKHSPVVVWCPDSVDEIRELQASLQMGVSGDGI